LLAKKPSEIKIPSITLAELYVGGERSAERTAVLRSIRNFTEPFEIVPFDDRAAASYGTIRAALIDGGLRVGPNDIAIAATVLSRDGILVTNNEKDFSRVEGLSIENWT
jgi:tRNA(fMet)-specific endonuclease VapC